MRALMMLCAAFWLAVTANAQQGVKVEDISQLQSVGTVQFSPDGNRLLFNTVRRDRPEGAYSETWIRNLSTEKTIKLNGSRAHWSPDGNLIAYTGWHKDRYGIIVSHSDGSKPVFLAGVLNTNHPLPSRGANLSWGPDSRRIAFVSATPGPDPPHTRGGPIVIQRYLYKPPSSIHGFNDNRRLHIFMVDIETKEVEQITNGNFYEHSIDWSPDGTQILFVSNREPDPDQRFNYDIFAVSISDKTVHRLTNTESNEYRPRWSPNGANVAYQGTRRGLTSSETTMEDTHIWVMNADGSNRRELGASIDNRQGAPEWSPDGSEIYFTVHEEGLSLLYKIEINAMESQLAIDPAGSIRSFALSKESIAYTLTTNEDLAQLHLYHDGKDTQLTNLNSNIINNYHEYS